jgi:hypothetical protein
MRGCVRFHVFRREDVVQYVQGRMKKTRKLKAMCTPDNRIAIRCPKCRAPQELIIDEEEGWYEIERDGRVWPEFVCMGIGGPYPPNPDRSCDYMNPIWIVNLEEILG